MEEVSKIWKTKSMNDFIHYCSKCEKPVKGNDHSACFTQEERDDICRLRMSIMKEITEASEDIELANVKNPVLVRCLALLDQIKETVKNVSE